MALPTLYRRCFHVKNYDMQRNAQYYIKLKYSKP